MLRPPTPARTRPTTPWIGRGALIISILGCLCAIFPPLVMFILPILVGRAWWLVGDSPVPVLAIGSFMLSFVLLAVGGILGIIATSIKAGRRSGIAAIFVAALPIVLTVAFWVLTMLSSAAMVNSFPR